VCSSSFWSASRPFSVILLLAALTAAFSSVLSERVFRLMVSWMGTLTSSDSFHFMASSLVTYVTFAPDYMSCLVRFCSVYLHTYVYLASTLSRLEREHGLDKNPPAALVLQRPIPYRRDSVTIFPVSPSSRQLGIKETMLDVHLTLAPICLVTRDKTGLP
jgi:hypothetical protein